MKNLISRNKIAKKSVVVLNKFYYATKNIFINPEDLNKKSQYVQLTPNKLPASTNKQAQISANYLRQKVIASNLTEIVYYKCRKCKQTSKYIFPINFDVTQRLPEICISTSCTCGKTTLNKVKSRHTTWSDFALFYNSVISKKFFLKILFDMKLGL